MKRSLRSLILVCAGSLAFVAGASAQQSTTRQMSGVPCSATASFAVDASAHAISYGGGVSCAGGAGQKTLNVVPQVFNIVGGQPLWFNISLIGLYQGPTPINPLRLSGSAIAVPTHVYRVLVYGGVELPDGRSASTTVCAGNCVGSPTLSIASSHTYAPQVPTTVQMQGIPCSVTQNGPVFTLVNNTYVNNYGGGTSCAGGAGERSLRICAQVSNRSGGKTTWFTITGSCLSQGPTTVHPLRLNTARTAYLGHGYRIMASATSRYPGSNGPVTRSVTAFSREWAP